MKAIWKNEVIAESDATIVIEGNQYFPPESVVKEFLRTKTHSTTCPWKGEAQYYDVVVGESVNQNAAWYYPTPKAGSVERVGQDFAGYVAFWNGVEVVES